MGLEGRAGVGLEGRAGVGVLTGTHREQTEQPRAVLGPMLTPPTPPLEVCHENAPQRQQQQRRPLLRVRVRG